MFGFMDIRSTYTITLLMAHLTFSRFISCCSGLNTSMPLQLPLKPFLTIFMGTIRKLYRARSILSIDSIENIPFTLSFHGLRMSNPIYRSGKVIAEMIEMNKVIAVSALAMAGMFSTRALADESKTGFYVTGKAGASVMSLADQRFLSGDGEETSKYKGGDGMIRYSVAVSR